MKVTEVIFNRFKIKRPHYIADEMVKLFTAKKENGQQNPIDDIVEKIINVIGKDTNIEHIKKILGSILKEERLPNIVFEEVLIKLFQEEKLQNAIIKEVILDSEFNIPDRIIEKLLSQNILNFNKRLELVKKIKDEDIFELAIQNELKILYETSREKNDNEIVENIEILNETIGNIEDDEEIKSLIRQIVAKKMAENYYSDIRKGTKIYTFLQVISAEDMIKYDIVTLVEREYLKLEQKEGKKEKRFNKFELKMKIFSQIKNEKDKSHYEEKELIRKLHLIPEDKREDIISIMGDVLDQIIEKFRYDKYSKKEEKDR